ncbi:tyrosine-type recombinase/integrase, partial [Escherichia coli]|uniref:tyrosine-type recombinase/integrase n=1 Tax=Escherichia coli TaxID=562 RepID=UPI002351756E
NTNKVFVSQKGGNLTISGVNNLFNKIRHDLKIEELTPHELRHTFCHDLIEKGFPINYVADLAGHSDLDTTRRYVANSDKEMKIAVESLSSGRYRQTENKKNKGEDER